MDPLFQEVQAFAIETGRASIGLIQRRFEMGYARAAQIVEELTRLGVVTSSSRLVPVAVPPHFNYFCIGCTTDFSSTERIPFGKRGGDPMQPYYCARCAAIEIGRSS